MNFPYRSTARIFLPASARAVLIGEPMSTRSPRNSALTMRRPTTAGRSVRTTVSTSGSSGIALGQIDEDVRVFDLDAVDRNAHAVIDEARAAARIEFPHVPGANHHSL